MYTCRKGTVTAHGLQLTKVGTEAASAMMTDWCFATQGIVLTDKECDKRDKDSRRHIVLRPQLCVPAKSMTSSRKRDASTAVCDDACDDDVFDDNDNDDGDGDIHSVSTQRMKLSFYVVYCEEDGRGEHGEHGEHDDNAAHYDSDDDDTKWYSDSFLLTPFDLPIYPQRTLYFGRVTAHVEALKDYESRLAPCYFLEVASHTTRAAWGGDAAPLRFFRLPGIVREFRWETSLSQPKRWKGMFERRRVQIPTPSDRVSLLHECFDHLWEVECMDGAVDKEHAAAHASKLPSFRRHGVMRSIQRHEDMLHTSLSPNANNVGDFVNVTQVLLPAATPAAAVGLSGGATDTAILARILGSDTSIILNTDPIHDKDCIGGRTCAMKSSHSGGVSGEVDADDNEDARSGREGSIMCGGSRKGRDSGVARRQHQSDGRRSHYHQPQHQHHRHQLHKPTTAGSDESDKDEEEGCDDGPSAMRKRQRYLAESIPPARVSVAMTKHRDRTHSNSMKCIDDGAGDGDEEEDEEEDVEEDDDNDEDEQEDSEDDGDGDGDSEGASEYGISDDDDDGEGDEDEDDEDEDDDDQDPGIDSDDAQDIDDDDDHDDDDDDADDDIEYDDDQADDDDDDAEEN
jgi:hypothetical protein